MHSEISKMPNHTFWPNPTVLQLITAFLLNLESSVMKLKFPCRERMDAGTSNPNAERFKALQFLWLWKVPSSQTAHVHHPKNKQVLPPYKKKLKKDGPVDGIEDSWNLKESSWSIVDWRVFFYVRSYTHSLISRGVLFSPHLGAVSSSGIGGFSHSERPQLELPKTPSGRKTLWRGVGTIGKRQVFFDCNSEYELCNLCRMSNTYGYISKHVFRVYACPTILWESEK